MSCGVEYRLGRRTLRGDKNVLHIHQFLDYFPH